MSCEKSQVMGCCDATSDLTREIRRLLQDFEESDPNLQRVLIKAAELKNAAVFCYREIESVSHASVTDRESDDYEIVPWECNA